jgi:hypothetical protein
MIAYKIVEKLENNEYKFLFHNRKSSFKKGDNLKAIKKIVYESYDKKTRKKKLYLSGIHVIETKELCLKYLKRFKNLSNKTIILCEIKNWRRKPKGNPGVLLADSIKVIGEEK